MPMNEEVRIRKIEVKSTRKSKVPVTVLWKNSRMIRSHSIKVVASEILSRSQVLDVVKINIVGNPGTGKSTLAQTLAHLIHAQSKVPYAVKILNRDDLIDFKNTLSKLDPAVNWILVFDDVSFLKAQVSSTQLSSLEKEFTEIRHLPGGEDVKIISIFNFHYTMAVSKYLRQSDFHFYTSIGSSDTDNLIKVVGKAYAKMIRNFTKVFHEAYSPSKRYTFQLGKKGKLFSYPHREPFAPVFYFNGYQSRIVVFPTRQWIAPHCLACTGNTDIKMSSNDMADLDAKLKSKFGEGVIKQALRILCLQQGVYCYSKRTKQALTFMNKWISSNNSDLETLLNYYDIKDLPTKLKLAQEQLDASRQESESKPPPDGRVWDGIRE